MSSAYSGWWPRPIVCCLASAGLIAGCSDSPLPPAPSGLSRLLTLADIAAIDSQARALRDPEAFATRMALAVRGFGGFAFDTDGDLIIWLKDPTRTAAARAVVTEYLAKSYRGPGGRPGSNPPIRVQTADFDFLELRSVRDRVTEALAAERGLRYIGIDVSTNRVDVGADQDAVQRVAAILEHSGVPRTAIRIDAVLRTYVHSYGSDDPTTFSAAIGARTRR